MTRLIPKPRRGPWATAAIVAATSAPALAQVDFTPRDVFNGANGAVSVFAADVDGDGDTDLISASLFDRAIRWYESDGAEDPTFTPRDIFTNAFGATSVFAADVDGDGDTDILSASQGDNAIRWYENDGAPDPTFVPRAITFDASGARSVFAADVDGDGDTDILAAASGANAIRWYENDGADDPAFTRRTIFAGASAADDVFAADVDGDGDTDVLSASLFDNTIRWYENDGAADPAFTPRDIFTNADGATSVFATDVDGDGDTDVLSASSGDDTIRWYENDGADDPTFTPRDIFTGASGATSVFATDIDGDGDTDVLSASPDDDTIRWYENDGATDPAFTPHDIFTDASRAQSVFAADVDGDADMDVISASFFDNAIRWYESGLDPDPVVNTTAMTGHATIEEAIGAASNGDDLLAFPERFAAEPIIDFAGRGLSLRSRSAITQGASGVYTLADGAVLAAAPDHDMDLAGRTIMPVGAFAVLAADRFTMHHGAELDLAFSSSAYVDAPLGARVGGDLDLALNSSLGFSGDLDLPTAAVFTPNNITTGASRAQSVFAADVDGDGDTDVLSASAIDDTIRWYENDGATDPAFTPRDIFAGADGANSVFAADLDGDGDTDVLSASFDDNAIRWYENDGDIDPGFTPHDIFLSANAAVCVFAADVDGDGDMDVLSASTNDNAVRWYENNGAEDPVFIPHDIFTSATRVFSVFAADVDGDGDTDVLSASAIDDTIRWYENDGATDPAFTPRDIFAGADGANSVFAADLDGDGDTDVLSTSGLDDTIRWYENDGADDPAFTPRDVFTSAAGATSVFATDVDSDGDMDVLSASTNDNAIRWYENNGAADPAFMARDVFTDATFATAVFAADIDGDGDTDALSASLFDNAIRWYEQEPDTAHSIRAGALLAVEGEISNGVSLDLLSGTISAEGGMINRGVFTGFGDIDADVVNESAVLIQNNTSVLGDYTNNGVTTIQNGILTILGALTNNGSIIGDLGGLDPRGERSGGVFIESDLTLGAAATLRMPSERARLSVGGNVDIAINSSTRFDMSLAELRMVALGGAQSLEVMSADLGADPGGPGMPESDYRIGTLRVGPTATSVILVDNRDNDSNGQQDSEAIYVRSLVIDAGATLNTNGRRVYYETLTLDGAVDDPDNLIQLGSGCATDWDGNGVVNAVDVGAFLTEYFEDLANGTLLTDFDGNGVVNAADVGAFLSQYFEDLVNPDCNGD